MLLLNLVNNFQCISMNFSESTVERGLAHHKTQHHCYQKHKLLVTMVR